MSLNLDQFKASFFQEGFTNLDRMEQLVIRLEDDPGNSASIQAIFRVCHSLKGSAGTFGFTEVTTFAHALETLLDEVRQGNRRINDELITQLLLSTDVMRNLLQSLEAGEVPNTIESESVIAALGQMSRTDDSCNAKNDVADAWHIDFYPHNDFLQTGNDPALLLRELGRLGQLQLTLQVSEIPAWEGINPELSWLAWTIELQGKSIKKEAITEIFEWVDTECDLEVVNANPSESHSPIDLHEGEVNLANGDATATTSATSTAAKKQRMMRVNAEKIDLLLDYSGEINIAKDMLNTLFLDLKLNKVIPPHELRRFEDRLDMLHESSRGLQNEVMSVRMQPMTLMFDQFPRIVRDLSRKVKKRVNLKISGATTVIDKDMIDLLMDPLVQLIRNALDHGLEIPEVRKSRGKPEEGLLRIAAYQEHGFVHFEIEDDGNGLSKRKLLEKATRMGLINPDAPLNDRAIDHLIFAQGLSTADELTQISGRGVGMDIVKDRIEEIGGFIDIKSKEGKGTTFHIRLPMSMSLLEGQVVNIAKQTYIIPLIAMLESVALEGGQYHHNRPLISEYQWRNEKIKILNLRKAFHLSQLLGSSPRPVLLIVDGKEYGPMGIIVDDLLEQKSIIVKSLQRNFIDIPWVSGSAILGNGEVTLILDCANVIRNAFKSLQLHNEGAGI
ncbi:MAG: chemotaxis protein CheA [Zetaproteobacteria bacterium]|nr:chemotaxis protein CheA [Zetaproteobacteria bacterium]